MKAISIIFPHQLFSSNPSIDRSRPIYLVEEILLFNQYSFHKQKILLHRASMKKYEEMLLKKKLNITYIEAKDKLSDIRRLIKDLAKNKIEEIHYTDTADNWLEKRIQLTAAENEIRLVKYPSPNFLTQPVETEEFFAKRKTYFQTDFYTWQRKKRNILVGGTGQPTGGKWTFDTENRLKIPKNEIIPGIQFPKENKQIKEAREYVNKFFAANYGEIEIFIYPTTHTEAEKWLDDFLQNRFKKFGIYEDAMAKNENFLYHAVLTPMLNIGLLDPQQIINKAIEAADQYNVPLNSLEGFVRQIMGWREFIRIVYEREGIKQRTTNYWGFTRKIPSSFWTGETGIHPIDRVIKKALKTGYSHHIERLMVVGNFMLLCEFDPDEVYRWFMEMYVDSYDWVMVPNVYGMTQFADGGLMTTKPYISSSNYILKMGDWNKGPRQEIWEGLFWRFMHVHRDFFLKNPRLGMLIKIFDKMPVEKRNTHLKNAAQYLESLTDESKEKS